jgi:hypothetical protein
MTILSEIISKNKTWIILGIAILMILLTGRYFYHRADINYGKYLASEDARKAEVSKAEQDRAEITRRYEDQIQAIKTKSLQDVKKAEEAKAKAENEAAKAKENMKKLSDDELTQELNKYVNGAFFLTAAGFLTNRGGAEFTLSIFYDKDKFQKMYNEEKIKSDNLLANLGIQADRFSEAMKAKDAAWGKEIDATNLSLVACQKALKSARRNILKTVGTGTVVTIIIYGGLKLLRVI